MKKNKKKLTFKRIIKIMIRNLICLIVGLVYLVVLTFKTINNLVVRLFKKLPTWLKVATIYILVIGNISHLVSFYESVKGLEINEEKVVAIATTELKENEIIEIEQVKNEIVIVEETKTCKMSEIECKIFNKALENEMTEEQAYLLVAISKHETGNWTSKLFKENNNFGGLYNSSKETFYSYETQEEGLDAFVNLLKKWYFGQGLNTIEEIGAKYCPVGAKNDPNGVNQYWVPRVTQYHNEYLGK